MAMRLVSVAFRPGADLLRRGVDVLGVIDELHSLGAAWTVADAGALPPFDGLEADTAWLAWRWLVLTEHAEERLREVFLFAAAGSELRIETLEAGVPAGHRPDARRLQAWAGAAPIVPPRGLPACAAPAAPAGPAASAPADDGLLVEVGDHRLVLPLAPVAEIVDLASARQASDGTVLDLRGQALPCVRLHDVLDGPSPLPAARRDHRLGQAGSQVVVLHHGTDRLGLVVDRVPGRHLGVVAPLSPLAGAATPFNGTTLLADGQVALVLDLADPARLIRLAAGMHA